MNERIDPRNERHSNRESIEAYFDGELAGDELRALERHLTSCARCHGVLTELRAVDRRLRELPLLAPRRDLAARIVEELDPELERRRTLARALSGVGHLRPSPGFAERTVERVRIHRSRAGKAGTSERASERRWRWVRDPGRLWAALGGLAVAPVATMAAVGWAVLSNPRFSPSAFLSFLGWKLAAAGEWLLEAAGGAAASVGRILPGSGAAGSLLETGPSLSLLGVGLLLGMLGSVWALYRTLTESPPLTRRINGHRAA